MLAILLLFLAALRTASFEADFVAEFLSRPVPEFVGNLSGQDLADYINVVQPFFEANFSKLNEERKKQVMELDTPVTDGETVETYTATYIPENFDARKTWPYCKSIGLIRDQSACGSCWAVSGAAAMSDRLCIRSKGRKRVLLSDADLISCCKLCNPFGGCRGAWPYLAWKYVMIDGICTGGFPENPNVCKPYPFLPCYPYRGQKYKKCPKRGYRSPQCKRECQSTYKTKYQADKFYAESAYYVKTGDVKAIQTEIMKNGPVQAVFDVYDDFFLYKKGIYVPTTRKKLGVHAVKIIGWGIENKLPYWLIANSYNVDFGEEGFFRMIRGYNAARIETYIITGMMKG